MGVCIAVAYFFSEREREERDRCMLSSSHCEEWFMVHGNGGIFKFALYFMYVVCEMAKSECMRLIGWGF